MYDYFVAPRRCPSCGLTTPSDSSTNMQTHIRDDASGTELGIGFEFNPLEVRPQDIQSSGYQLIRQPAAGEPILLLETWEHTACGRGDLWAVITIEGVRITSIEAATLDRPTFDRAHYISDKCFVLAARLAGIAASDIVARANGCVDVLREHLRQGGSRDE
jgi:hypothetical protein